MLVGIPQAYEHGDTSGKRNPQMEFLPIVQDSLPTKRISIKVLRY